MTKFSQRMKTLEAIGRSSIHQSLATPSSHVAMARARAATVQDPKDALDLLRALVQSSITEEIKKVMNRYVESFFRPAFKNAQANLGEDQVSPRLLDDVCSEALQKATDELYANGSKAVKRANAEAIKVPAKKKKKKKKQDRLSDRGLRPNTDLILVSKTGKPVRREGSKWEAERLVPETLFILGSKANKALGFGQTRGRLYIKHPEYFKYSGDQEDKEWLAKNQLMTTTGGKAYLMVLEDILELAHTPDYASHPRQQPNELIGFTVPQFMLAKMKSFMAHLKTDPSIPDEALLKYADNQFGLWEEARKGLMGLASNPTTVAATVKYEAHTPKLQPASIEPDLDEEQKKKVQEILNEIKTEEAVVAAASSGGVHTPNTTTSADEVDLGFLHGMNLSHLVREFELDTTGSAAEHLSGLLSLTADDMGGAEEVFSELTSHESEDHHHLQGDKIKEEEPNDSPDGGGIDPDHDPNASINTPVTSSSGGSSTTTLEALEGLHFH